MHDLKTLRDLLAWERALATPGEAMPKPDVTIRRHLEQIKHCVEEALSVVVHEEDPVNAENDLAQAAQLIEIVRKAL